MIGIQKKKTKFLIAFFLILLLFFLNTPRVMAEETGESVSEGLYQEQVEKSGANSLWGELPDSTKELMNHLGAVNGDFRNIGKITPQEFFSMVFGLTGKEGSTPLKAAASSVAIMVLCAMVSALRLSVGTEEIGSAVGVVGALCVCVCVVEPLIYSIVAACAVIKTAAGFSLATIPIMGGILLAGGQPVSAASWQLLTAAAGNGVELISAQILAPAMRIFLAISIVSSLSPDLKLSGICQAFSKGVKWILGFLMTVFTGLLTMRQMVSTSVDTGGNRAAKFVVSSFVPVVGSALSEAIHTVSGCVGILKSGVGAFVLFAEAIIFLPSILSCLVWIILLSFCAGVGDIFALKELSDLLRACSSVMETLLAILICSLTVLTVSSVLLVIVGGGNTA